MTLRHNGLDEGPDDDTPQDRWRHGIKTSGTTDYVHLPHQPENLPADTGVGHEREDVCKVVLKEIGGPVDSQAQQIRPNLAEGVVTDSNGGVAMSVTPLTAANTVAVELNVLP